MRKLYIISILIFFLISNGYALEDSSFANGWYWGKDENKVSEPVIDHPSNTKVIIKPNITHSQVLKEINSQVEELKSRAIIEPTSENVANYIRVQNKVVNMASKFSAGWEKALLEHPELNYTALNPTNNYAKQILAKEKKNEISHSIQEFAQSYGLIFFFEGKKAMDAFQSKIVNEFATSNRIAIVAVSLDKETNQYFPNPSADNNRSKKLGITVTPALIALNVNTKTAYPISFGVISQNELEEQIDKFMRGLL